MTEETHDFTPTVVYRAGAGALEAAVADHVDKGRALFLFASEEEVDGYRRELLPEDERLELYEVIVRLRRKLGR